MDNSLLEKLKENYNKSMKQNEDIRKDLQILMKRKKILENSPIVKDYINLLEQIEKTKHQIFSESEIFSGLLTYLDCQYNCDTNKIYCYAGTFINEGEELRLVDKDYFFGEFDRYIDIESLCAIDIPVEDREVFEKENTIVYADNIYELHDNFIIDCIIKNQDTAVKKVLLRERKNN